MRAHDLSRVNHYRSDDAATMAIRAAELARHWLASSVEALDTYERLPPATTLKKKAKRIAVYERRVRTFNLFLDYDREALALLERL